LPSTHVLMVLRMDKADIPPDRWSCECEVRASTFALLPELRDQALEGGSGGQDKPDRTDPRKPAGRGSTAARRDAEVDRTGDHRADDGRRRRRGGRACAGRHEGDRDDQMR
jgi:hypothetical protein